MKKLIFISSLLLFVAGSAYGQSWPRFFWEQIELADSTGRFAISNGSLNGEWNTTLRLLTGNFLRIDADTAATRAYARSVGGGGAAQLSDLTDVNTSTPTNKNVLVADGVDWESRALLQTDITGLNLTSREVAIGTGTGITSETGLLYNVKGILEVQTDLGTGNIGISPIGSTTLTFVDAASDYNVVVGHEAMNGALSGADDNVALGRWAGKALTTGDRNTFVGYNSGVNLTTGQHNFFGGNTAGANRTNISGSTFVGVNAGSSTTLGAAGSNSVSVGNLSGANLSGSGNVTVGTNALYYLFNDIATNNAVAIGNGALERNNIVQNNSIGIGYRAGYFNATYDNLILIGSEATPTQSNQIVIGHETTGSTQLKVRNYRFNIDQTVGAGQDGQVLSYNNGTGEIELSGTIPTTPTVEDHIITPNASGVLSQRVGGATDFYNVTLDQEAVVSNWEQLNFKQGDEALFRIGSTDPDITASRSGIELYGSGILELVGVDTTGNRKSNTSIYPGRINQYGFNSTTLSRLDTVGRNSRYIPGISRWPRTNVGGIMGDSTVLFANFTTENKSGGNVATYFDYLYKNSVEDIRYRWGFTRAFENEFKQLSYQEPVFEVLLNKFALQSYYIRNTIDSSGSETPINFLYTDADGKILSSDISAIVNSPVAASASGTTDGSGDLTISHGLATATIYVTATATGITPYVLTVHTKTSTTFKIRFFDSTGAAVTSTAVTADWIAKK